MVSDLNLYALLTCRPMNTLFNLRQYKTTIDLGRMEIKCLVDNVIPQGISKGHGPHG